MATAMKIYCLICSIALISCANQPTNETGLVANEAAHSSVPKELASMSPSDSLEFSKDELTKIYVQSIAHYIEAMKKDCAIKFDTLYFGKHVYEQPDDFPDIELPAIIENTQIRLVSPSSDAAKQMDNKSSLYINLISWVNHHTSEFIFVAFNSNYEHLFDYSLSYDYNTVDKEFHLAQAKFERFKK